MNGPAVLACLGVIGAGLGLLGLLLTDRGLREWSGPNPRAAVAALWRRYRAR